MGNSNHSKKGLTKNQWYRRRNRLRNPSGCRDLLPHHLRKEVVVEHGGMGNPEMYQRELKEREAKKQPLPTIQEVKDHDQPHPKATTNWFGKAWSGVKNRIIGR